MKQRALSLKDSASILGVHPDTIIFFRTHGGAEASKKASFLGLSGEEIWDVLHCSKIRLFYKNEKNKLYFLLSPCHHWIF